MKNFKGKKIEKSNYKNGNVEYDGFIDVDSGKPHGKGICIVRRKDNTIGM